MSLLLLMQVLPSLVAGFHQRLLQPKMTGTRRRQVMREGPQGLGAQAARKWALLPWCDVVSSL